MQEDAVRVSVVSYLNSKPFSYGLEKSNKQLNVSVTYDVPAKCAEKLINGNADIGLVPVAVIPLIPEAQIISDYCISADGKVDSVLLLSDVPVQNIKTIILDNESRTSVLLARILANELWKIQPEWMQESSRNELQVNNATGVVVIGDRALKLRTRYRYCYDLAAGWKELTGLPFVFACWVANKHLPDTFISEFNKSLQYGINHMEEVVLQENLDAAATAYLKETIIYQLNDRGRKAIELFLGKIQQHQPK